MILYNPTISGSLAVTGSLTTTGTITSQTLVVQTITSSVSYLTGSTQHGSVIGNTHQFTGSVSVSGSVGIGTNSPSQLLEVVGGEIKAGRVDTTNEGGQVSFGRASDNNTAWYIDAYGNVASPQLRFVDVTNAAVRMTLTGSNVGIGVTPNAWTSFTALQLGGSTYSAVASSNHYLNVAANSYYDGTNFKYIVNGFSTRYQQSDGTHLWYIAASGTAGNTVSYSEAVRIETDGNLQVNNAKGLKLFTESNGAYWLIRSYNGASNQFRFNYQGSDLAGISTVNGSYTAFSDVNKKKDFEPSQIGLNEVLGLKPTLYRIKTQGDTEDKQLGFIAQEVKEFIPQAYSETGEGDDKFIGLTEMPIIAALTKAIQEQQAKITALEEILQRNNIQ
jgi:cyclophilin family peptidyl-prolyl cis-trans isomerase